MDDKLFRTAMGKFATGVTVILSENELGGVRGMTANAFMSVSLDPKLILISIGNQAKMKSYIEQHGRFSVNVLAENQKDISMLFAGQLKEERQIDFEYLNDVAIIDGAVANIVCDVYDTVVAGDHTLFIGAVKGLKISDGEPLIFSEGKYKKLTSENINV